MTDASEVKISDDDKAFLIEEHAAAMCAGAESNFDAWIVAIKALIARRVPDGNNSSWATDYTDGFDACRERVLKGSA